MRFAFAGIDFLGDVFHTLIESGWEPVKLFSRPCDGIYDFNEVTLARACSLRVPVQTSRIRPADLAELENLRCEALVVAGYPWLVKGWEEHLPYAINYHPSPLPEGRGPYPLFQAILEERRDWGVSVHALAPAFDTGPILAHDCFPLGPDETHDTLLARCQIAVKRLSARLATGLPDLWANAAPQGAGSYWPRVTERQRTLDWSRPVAEVLRTVRAFGSIETIAPVGGKRLHVWSASGWTEAHRLAPDENHDTLLAKCQIAAKDLSRELAMDLPQLWARARPQAGGSYWPRITEAHRTLDWSRSVADLLRTIRAFGSIEVIAPLNGKRLFVWSATGWTEAHGLVPGSVVHKHRRHLVVAARDGFIQLTGWSSNPPRGER